MHLVHQEDNEPAITILKKGWSPNLRSLARTHGLSLVKLHDEYYNEEDPKEDIEMRHCNNKCS